MTDFCPSSTRALVSDSAKPRLVATRNDFGDPSRRNTADRKQPAASEAAVRISWRILSTGIPAVLSAVPPGIVFSLGVRRVGCQWPLRRVIATAHGVSHAAS